SPGARPARRFRWGRRGRRPRLPGVAARRIAHSAERRGPRLVEKRLRNRGRHRGDPRTSVGVVGDRRTCGSWGARTASAARSGISSPDAHGGAVRYCEAWRVIIYSTWIEAVDVLIRFQSSGAWRISTLDGQSVLLCLVIKLLVRILDSCAVYS